jgi:hypothetical protein
VLFHEALQVDHPIVVVETAPNHSVDLVCKHECLVSTHSCLLLPVYLPFNLSARNSRLSQKWIQMNPRKMERKSYMSNREATNEQREQRAVSNEQSEQQNAPST